MITAVDFGCNVMRCLFRDPSDQGRLRLYAERSEYAAIPATSQHRRNLEADGIAVAECDDSLVVVGNDVVKANWLSRLPLTPLFDEGRVPVDDPPAWQLLNVLLESMLPTARDGSICAITVPCGDGSGPQLIENQEFLSRLIRMKGYEPIVLLPSSAAMLSTGAGASFRGITIVIGSHSCSLTVSRFGVPIAEQQIAVGADWIDQEVARQFNLHVYDEAGTCYLDVQQVRAWRQSEKIYLRNPMSDRERLLQRLYTVLLDRIAKSIVQMLDLSAVRHSLTDTRLSVTVAGGPAYHAGFANLLTERFIEHNIAERIASVNIAEQCETAVVRGALIHAELEALRTGQRVIAA